MLKKLLRVSVYSAVLLFATGEAQGQSNQEAKSGFAAFETDHERHKYLVKLQNDRFIERSELKIKELKAELKKVVKTKTYDSRQARKSDIKNRKGRISYLEKTVKQIKKREQFHYDSLSPRLGPHSLGKISWCRVFQVIDDKSALVRIGSKPKYVGGESEREELVILHIDTEGLVDDSPLSRSEIFFVNGTSSYSTAGGSKKTVRVLDPLDTGKIEQELSEEVKKVSGKLP